MYQADLYHGTRDKFRVITEGFNEDMFLSGRGLMVYGCGFYASKNKKIASKYGKLLKVRVTLNNPITGREYFRRFRSMVRTGKIYDITNKLKREGYDGILIKDSTKDEVCVFDAKNIIAL